MRQINPEFSQSSYERAMMLEQKYKISNYLESNISSIISDCDRTYGIQKIMELHKIKKYKVETFFLATGIFDRYIYKVGAENFQK
jgi:hypothetical protein